MDRMHVLVQAFRYMLPFRGLLLACPHDRELSSLGWMNEGVVSTRMGVSGVSRCAETLAMHRYLEILAYTGGALHLSLLSTGRGVDLVSEAKQKKMAVSADVAWHHLLFNDEALEGYDVQHKVFPPYRTEADRQALCKGISSGAVDAIVSHHMPQSEETKLCPLSEASYGMIGLPLVLPALLRLEKELPLSHSLRALYAGPRRILGMDIPVIRKGEAAYLTVFDRKKEWVLGKETSGSRSVNSPFLHKRLMGRVCGVWRKKEVFIQPSA